MLFLPAFGCFSSFLAPFPLHGILNFLKISLILGCLAASEGGWILLVFWPGGLFRAFEGLARLFALPGPGAGFKVLQKLATF